MSLKSIFVSVAILVGSVNSYAVVLNCHRKTDQKQTQVGSYFMDGARPTLLLESELFDYYGYISIPVGSYKLDNTDDVKKVVYCRDGFEPTVELTETPLESGLEFNIAVTCFDDPKVVTNNYELVCH